MTKRELRAEFKTWKRDPEIGINIDHKGGAMKARIFAEANTLCFPSETEECGFAYQKYLCSIRYPNDEKVKRLARWLREFQEIEDGKEKA